MQFAKLIYDPEATRQRTQMSTGSTAYIMSPLKFSNPNKCRMLGLVAGQDVSISPGNLVDLESDLTGRTRVYTKYNCNGYTPKCASGRCGCPKGQGQGIPYDCKSCTPPLRHLSECSMYNRPKPMGMPGYKVTPPSCAHQDRGKKQGPGLTPYAPFWSALRNWT
jgi:hypothetical protein